MPDQSSWSIETGSTPPRNVAKHLEWLCLMLFSVMPKSLVVRFLHTSYITSRPLSHRSIIENCARMISSVWKVDFTILLRLLMAWTGTTTPYHTPKNIWWSHSLRQSLEIKCLSFSCMIHVSTCVNLCSIEALCSGSPTATRYRSVIMECNIFLPSPDPAMHSLCYNQISDLSRLSQYQVRFLWSVSDQNRWENPFPTTLLLARGSPFPDVCQHALMILIMLLFLTLLPYHAGPELWSMRVMITWQVGCSPQISTNKRGDRSRNEWMNRQADRGGTWQSSWGSKSMLEQTFHLPLSIFYRTAKQIPSRPSLFEMERHRLLRTALGRWPHEPYSLPEYDKMGAKDGFIFFNALSTFSVQITTVIC